MVRTPTIVGRPGFRVSSRLLAILMAAVAAIIPSPATAQTETAKEISTSDVEPTFKLQVERNLVVVRVVVRNKNGATVDNLRKEDFQLFDHGKLQVISQFSVEKTTLKAAVKTPEKKPAATAEEEPTDETAISPSAARRFLGIYFDDVSTSYEDLIRTRDATDHYLSTSLQVGDRVGLFTASGQNQVNFTDDVAKVHEALLNLRPRPVVGQDTSCGAIPPYEAFLIFTQHDPQALDVATNEILNCRYNGDSRSLQQAQNDAETEATHAASMNETESRASLRGIELLVRSMAGLPGQRSVVIVSAGFLTENLHFELDTIVDRALRSNVIVSALDARGLYTDATLDATVHSVATSPRADVWGKKNQYSIESAYRQSDGIKTIALDTGGFFFSNSNDLEGGFRQAAALPQAYYVLAFSPQNLKLDGAFHPIRLKLVPQLDYNLQARRGYYAPRKPEDPKVQEKEEIEEALFSQDETHELPMEVHTQFFMKTETDAQLAVLTRLDLRQLHFRKQEERNLDNLTFVTGVFDRDGHLVSGQEKLLTLKLRDDSLARYLQTGITLKLNFDVKPGTYLVRAVVRDSESGQISGLNRTVEIPY